MRACRLIGALLLATALAFLVDPPRALAEEPRKSVVEVAIVSEEATHLFNVAWERGSLKVTLLGPDGSRYPQDDPPPGTRVAIGDRLVIFRVDQAKPGLWRAELQEFDNGHIGFIVQKLFRPLVVKDVAARQQGTGISVDFQLEGEPGTKCTYTVYLGLEGGQERGLVLGQGQAAVGEKVRVRFPAEEVSSYQSWVVTVYAESTSQGFTDFHSASSPAFTFSNPRAPGPVASLAATFLADGIRATWEPPQGASPLEYLVVVRNAEGKVLHSVTVGSDKREATLPLAAASGSQLQVMAKSSQGYGPPAMLDLAETQTLKQLLGLDLPERPVAAGGYVELAYDTGGKQVPLRLEKDGKLQDVVVSGKGVLRVPVHSGTNRLKIAAEAGPGLWVEESRRWLLDLSPPVLRVFEDWDGLSTRSSALLLGGWVEDGSEVSLNGARVTVDPHGVFARRIELAAGENLLVLTAKDTAGNVTTYQARVIREGAADSRLRWWVWLGVSLACGIAAAGGIFWGARRRRSRSVIVAGCAVVLGLSLIGVVVGGAMLARPHSARVPLPMPRVTPLEAEAWAALAVGDAQSAHRSAVQASLLGGHRPMAWLLAARSALLSGDLPAAVFYYQRLHELSAAELEAWGLAGASAELGVWERATQLQGSAWREAAGQLAAQVRETADRELEQEAAQVPLLKEAVENRRLLTEIAEEVRQVTDDTSAADVSRLDGRLAELVDQPGASEARSLRIKLLSSTEQWRPLVRWLLSEGSPGLVEAAELVVNGVLPAETLAGSTAALGGGTAAEAVAELAGRLEEASEDGGRMSLGCVWPWRGCTPRPT